MAPNPYAPDEPPEAIWFEQTIFIGPYVGAIAFGIHIIVYSYCVYYIFRAKRPSWPSLVYTTVLFVLAAINLACNIRFNQLAYVDSRAYPGGPLGFASEQQSEASLCKYKVNTIGNSATSITGAMSDALLIWRCYVIWSKKLYIIIIPFFGLISACVLTSLTVYQASRPFSSLWASNTAKYGTPYWSILCGLNILVTALMVSRLLWTRRRVQEILGPEHSKMYTTIAAMIVESALPYAICSFIYVILYAVNSPAQNLFLPLFAQLQCIAPELIVLRVSRGHAWESTTATTGGAQHRTRTTYADNWSKGSPGSSDPSSSQTPSDPTSLPSSSARSKRSRMPRFAYPSRPSRRHQTTTFGTTTGTGTGTGTLDSESAMREGMMMTELGEAKNIKEENEQGEVLHLHPNAASDGGLYDVSLLELKQNPSIGSGISGKKENESLV